jgi:uncharacterized protein (TIGR02265 family)
MDARCFYGRFVNGILEHLAPRLDADACARLAALGLDPAQPHDIYRARTFYAAVPILAAAVAPGVPGEQAERALGSEVAAAYAASELGRSIVGYFTQLGTRATLLEAQTFFRTGCNFLIARPVPLEGDRIRLKIRGTEGHAAFYCGILEGAYRRSGTPGIRVELADAAGDAATIDVAW